MKNFKIPTKRNIKKGKFHHGEIFELLKDPKFYSLASDDVYVLEKGIIDDSYQGIIEFVSTGVTIVHDGSILQEASLYLRFDRSR